MHESWFFIGIFVFIFIVWIATGGPLHPIAFTGPSLAQPQELGGGTYLKLPRVSFGIGSGNNVSLPGSSNGQSVTGSSYNSNGQAVTSTSFGPSSTYRNAVRMNHYVSGANSTNPNTEYVELSIGQDAGGPVDISGWTLSSDASGNAMTIPKGTRVPTSGIVNDIQDIVLTPGERAIIISGRSPVGASFEENKCIGYFSTFQQFSPSLPQNCPAPSDELSSSYGTGYIRDAACIDYVNKLNRCQVALSPPNTVSGACQSFVLKYFNYNGCVDAHKSDADFSGDTWRIYLGRTAPMWRSTHEVVRLLDTKGKTVDAFSY